MCIVLYACMSLYTWGCMSVDKCSLVRELAYVSKWLGLLGTTQGTNPSATLKKKSRFLLASIPFIHCAHEGGWHSSGSTKGVAISSVYTGHICEVPKLSLSLSAICLHRHFASTISHWTFLLLPVSATLTGEFHIVWCPWASRFVFHEGKRWLGFILVDQNRELFKTFGFMEHLLNIVWRKREETETYGDLLKSKL